MITVVNVPFEGADGTEVIHLSTGVVSKVIVKN